MKRIQYLEQRHPDILFIGINMELANEDIMREPNLKKLDIQKQYKLTKESYANKFLSSKFPRVILINEKGLVVNGFTLLDSKNLQNELKKLELN